MTTAAELQAAGLLDQSQIPHLTEKGRDWLRLLEDLEHEEIAALAEDASDLILSTNGLFR